MLGWGSGNSDKKEKNTKNYGVFFLFFLVFVFFGSWLRMGEGGGEKRWRMLREELGFAFLVFVLGFLFLLKMLYGVNKRREGEGQI